jgi:uncharacterized membrane protein
VTSDSNSRLTKVLTGVFALAGLVGAGAQTATAQDSSAPAQNRAAQAQDTTPMALVVAVYPDPAAAGQAMNHMSADQKAMAESYAVVSKNQNGQVKVRQRHDNSGALGAQAGKTLDGAVALLGKPATNAGRRDSGAARPQLGMSSADASKIQSALQPDDAAIVLVVPETDAQAMNTALQPTASEPVMVVELEPTVP